MRYVMHGSGGWKVTANPLWLWRGFIIYSWMHPDGVISSGCNQGVIWSYFDMP